MRFPPARSTEISCFIIFPFGGELTLAANRSATCQ
jgi:hypothetical protein